MAVDVLDTILRLSGVGAYLTGFRQVSTSVNEASDKQVRFHQSGVAAFAGLGAVSVAVGAGLRGATKEAGQFEAKLMAFKRLFGGENIAKEMMADLREFSSESNFSFSGSVKFAQRLRAMGFEGRDLIPIMKTLGDAVAATGGGTDELDRVVLAFGQIRTRGKLVQQEINQLSQAGIPVEILFDSLQKRMGITQEDMRDIGRLGISSADAIAALLSGLNEHYGGQMEAWLESMPGRLHQLRNQWEMMRLEIGKPIIPGVKGITEGLGVLTKFLNQSPAVGAGVGGLGVGVAGVTGALSLNAFARMTGLAATFMAKQTGNKVSPLTSGMASGGIMGGLQSMLGGNPAEVARVQQFNAELKKLHLEEMDKFREQDKVYRNEARKARNAGNVYAGIRPVKPGAPTYEQVPGYTRGQIAGGIGLGLLAMGGAIGGGMLVSQAEGIKDPSRRWWTGFAGGALTGGATGAMMGMSMAGPWGALGLGVGGALLGGFATATGLGDLKPGENKQEKYSQMQLDKLDKIHQAIVEGTGNGWQMQSQVLSGGDDVRRPFPQSDFAKATAEGL